MSPSTAPLSLQNLMANLPESPDQLSPELWKLLREELASRIETDQISAELQSLARFPAENPNPVLRISADGRILYANEASAELLSEWDCQAGEAMPIEWRQFAKETLQNGVPCSLEQTIRAITYSFQCIPVGEAGYVNVYASDITSRKHAENALRENEKKYRLTVTSIGDAVITTDPQGNITFLNPVAEVLTGWTYAEAAGQPLKQIFTIINEYTGRLVENPVEKVLTSGHVEGLANHTALVGRNGQVIPIEDSAAPIHNEAGQILGVVLVFHDVTEKRKGEAALSYQAALLSNLNDAIIASDKDFHLTAWNQAAEQLYGWKAGEVLGKIGLDIIRTEFPEKDKAHMLESIAQTGHWRGEATQVRKDGSRFPVDVSSIVMRDQDGQITGYLSVNKDITERKRVELELQHSEELARASAAEINAVFEAMSDAVMVLDSTGKLYRANRAAKETYGFDPTDIFSSEVAKKISLRSLNGERIEIASLPSARAMLGQYVSGEYYQFTNPLGRDYTILVSANPLLDAGGLQTGAIVVWQDITRTYQAEIEAHKWMAENEIKHRLIQQREHERIQIARDLHDGPLQDLAVAIYDVQRLIASSTSPDMTEQLRALNKSLQGQIKELRSYAGELRPPTLASFGVEKAIHSHLTAFEEKHPNILVHFEAETNGDLLAEDARLALYRIYQQAMNNIVKHAKASEVWINFNLSDQEAVLSIKDNGCGFEIPQDWLDMARAGHLGLVGIRERAEGAGGTVQITSQPDCGTQIQVTLPLKSN